MSDRSGAYNAPDPCSESLEKMTKRLTSDLRARVRRLAHHTPLSPEWNEMTDTLQHLASVAMMEEKDTAKKDGSIWERDELCVRYIIEEGKINMLMRTMNEYKAYQYGASSEGTTWDEETRVRMKIFEQSLGILLRCAFAAVEALQTLDITKLIEHISLVLVHALESPDSISFDSATQEILVVTYLDLILKKLENLNEESVLGQFATNNTVPLVLKHYEKFAGRMDKEAQDAYVYFMANLTDSEGFQTHRSTYIPEKEDKKRLVLLEGRTKELLAVDHSNRKALRSLSDNIIRFK